MGQRLVISESERKHIMGLYEQVTYINESTPPNESIIIAKDKNPFKYEEYVNARQLYSPQMKDGDRFYVYRNFNYYWDSFDELIGNKLDNKTVRFTNADIIITLRHIKRINSYPYVGVNMQLFENNNPIPNAPELTVSKDSFLFNSRYSVDGSAKKEEELYVPNLQKVIEYTQSLISNYDKFYIEKIKGTQNLSTVPDKYFDIREVKRIQTDF